MIAYVSASCSGLLRGKNCLSAELHVFHVGRRDAKEASTCASDWVMIIKLLWLQHKSVAMTTAAPSTHLNVCNTPDHCDTYSAYIHVWGPQTCLQIMVC